MVKMCFSRDKNGQNLLFQVQKWPKIAQMCFSKAKNDQNEAGPGAATLFIWDKGKTDRFWQLVGGGPTWQPRQAKNEGMKAQKAKMKRNEGPKGQNERK